MSLDKDRWGQNVADAVAAIGITAGTPITPAQLAIVWKAIKGEDKTEFNANADIDLSAADISTNVPALGINDSVPLACTGQATGTNQAVILTQKIK
ncbi:MAG: hypothetical protein V3R67_07915 [Thermodesulfobacteriota bacterium]